jgi:hypothetical protein
MGVYFKRLIRLEVSAASAKGLHIRIELVARDQCREVAKRAPLCLAHPGTANRRSLCSGAPIHCKKLSQTCRAAPHVSPAAVVHFG